MSLVEKPITSFAQLLEVTKKIGTKKVVVAVAQEQVVLETIKEAEELGLIEATLVGSGEQITSLGNEFGWRIPSSKIVDELDYTRCIRLSVEMVRDKQADMIMKGKAKSADIYRVVLDHEMAMRTGRLLSQVVVCEVPGFDRFLLLADSSVSISPNLTQKAEICRNAIEISHALGTKVPKLAALAPVELVNPDIPSTVDAACLTVMNQRHQITGAIIDGPIALDAALAEWVTEEKGFESPIAGHTDIFICPDLDAANLLLRAIIYLAKGKAGGLVVGAAAPVLVLSRAEPVETKINSICLGILMAHWKEQGIDK